MLKRLLSAMVTAGKGVTAGLDIPLGEDESGRDPIALFDRWFRDAREAGLYLPEAMTLATATPGGAPSARMVLLKGFGADGFVFYTNYDSRKGHQIHENPWVSLCFFWPTLERQVREALGPEATLQDLRIGWPGVVVVDQLRLDPFEQRQQTFLFDEAPADPALAELRAYLLAEALDRRVGAGAGLSELREAERRHGPRPHRRASAPACAPASSTSSCVIWASTPGSMTGRLSTGAAAAFRPCAQPPVGVTFYFRV